MDTTKIIILRKIKFSESDLIIHGLSQRGGRLNFLARGALKSRRRFGGGVLEPTHYVQVTYHRKTSSPQEGQLYFLQEAQLLEDFQGLRAEYSRLELAFHFIQLVSQISQEGDEGSPELFDLLGHALRACSQSENLDVLRAHFELKLLHQQGVMPAETRGLAIFSRPLRNHSDIQITPAELNQVSQQVQSFLKNYLAL